ncbi:MAG: ribose-phosphate pyrophosphokinase [Bacteroidales bacterium]|nr:ribose-phosphate pyrophosphokinase [Bacteroidales bacterium]
MNSDIKIFAGSSGKEFAERMCQYLGITIGRTEIKSFSDGNTYVRIVDHVRDEEVYLVLPLGLDPNNEFVELLFWMDAFKRSGARYVTAVVPYFSYAKGDKKDESRVSIRARVCAECIELAGADRVITMDLHAAQIQGFFKKPVDHLFAGPLLAKYLKTIMSDNTIVVSPDAGFAKNARKFAAELGVDFAVGDKIRTSHDENAEIMELIGDVSGKDAVIIDDFSISAGTIVETAKILKKRGTKSIIACLSHIPLSIKGVEAIEKSDITLVLATDSINNPRIKKSPKIKIISVAPLFAEVVKRMQNRESISDLIDNIPEEVFQASIRDLQL